MGTNAATAPATATSRKSRKAATPTPAPTPAPAPVAEVPLHVPTGPAQRALGAIARAALREGVELPAATPAMVTAATASAAKSYADWRLKGGEGDLSAEAEASCAERRVQALRAAALLADRGVALNNAMAVVATAKRDKAGAKLADLVAACGAEKTPKAPTTGQTVDFDAAAVTTPPVAPPPAAPAIDKASLAARLAASGMDAADIVKVLIAL